MWKKSKKLRGMDEIAIKSCIIMVCDMILFLKSTETYFDFYEA